MLDVNALHTIGYIREQSALFQTSGVGLNQSDTVLEWNQILARSIGADQVQIMTERREKI